jgi:hypothetical protein
LRLQHQPEGPPGVITEDPEIDAQTPPPAIPHAPTSRQDMPDAPQKAKGWKLARNYLLAGFWMLWIVVFWPALILGLWKMLL